MSIAVRAVGRGAGVVARPGSVPGAVCGLFKSRSGLPPTRRTSSFRIRAWAFRWS